MSQSLNLRGYTAFGYTAFDYILQTAAMTLIR